VKIEDGDRPRLLEATESAMRTVDGLLDPRLLERLAAEAGVDPEVIAHRWGTGVSLIADVVSDKSGIATPGWPQAVHFDGATPRSILTALASGLAASLDGDNLTQAALSQVIASPVVRRVWSDFVSEDLEQWTDILANATGPHAPIDRGRAAQAVHLIARQCYSRVLLGEVEASVSDDRIITLALTLLDADDDFAT